MDALSPLIKSYKVVKATYDNSPIPETLENPRFKLLSTAVGISLHVIFSSTNPTISYREFLAKQLRDTEEQRNEYISKKTVLNSKLQHLKAHPEEKGASGLKEFNI